MRVGIKVINTVALEKGFRFFDVLDFFFNGCRSDSSMGNLKFLGAVPAWISTCEKHQCFT